MATQNYKNYFDELDSIILLFEALQNECSAKGYPIESVSAIEQVISKVLMKIYKSIIALRLLCKEGFTEDSQPIVRNVLESTIICSWLALDNDPIKLRQLQKKEDISAHERVVKYKLLLEEKQKLNPNEVTKRELENALEWLSRYKADSEVPNCPELYEMARIIDSSKKLYSNKMRMLHTIMYWLPTLYVHFSFESLGNFHWEEENLTSFVAAPNFDSVPEIILHICRISILFSEIFNKTFKLGLEQRIEDENVKLKHLAKNYIENNIKSESM